MPLKNPTFFVQSVMTHEIKFGKKKTFEGTYSQAFTLVSLLVDFLDFVPDGQQRTRQNVEGASSHPHTATKACLARLTQPIPVIRILFSILTSGTVLLT